MVPLVSRWYSVGILGCSAGVPGNVQLFRHCSGVFRCSAGVPCSGVPGFIVCHLYSAQYEKIILTGEFSVDVIEFHT